MHDAFENGQGVMAKRRTQRGTGIGRERPAGRGPVNGAGGDRVALDYVTRLMAIPGPSGQETKVAQFVRHALERAGAPPPVSQAPPRGSPFRGDTGNLVLKLPGTVRGPRRLLVAHMDTVNLCVGARPVRRGSRIVSDRRDTGLGADNRAGTAALLTAATLLFTKRLPHPPVTFLWTVQEESGMHGARCVATRLLGTPRLAFNFDGGAPEKLTIGATGGYRMTIAVDGLASHAGNAPEEGVSAVAIAALAVARLHRDGWHGKIARKDGSGTSNVGMIQGGTATNVVADRVVLRAEARSHDAAFRQTIVRQIETAFREAAQQVPSSRGKRGSVQFNGRLDYEAFCLPLDDPSVRAAEAAIEQVGRTPTHAVANGGLDANWLTHRGIPTVSLGAGQRNIHTVDEQLDVADFLDACRIAVQLATGIDAEPAS